MTVEPRWMATSPTSHAPSIPLRGSVPPPPLSPWLSSGSSLATQNSGVTHRSPPRGPPGSGLCPLPDTLAFQAVDLAVPSW